MRYEQIWAKMPESMKQQISSQPWCAAFTKDGVQLDDLLTDRSYLIHLLAQLSQNERNTLRLILSVFGCESFTADALERQASLQMAGAQAAVGLVGLRRAGVIAAFRKSWGEQLYALPEDAFDVWQGLLFPSVKLRSRDERDAGELEELLGGVHLTPAADDEQERAGAGAGAHPRGLAQLLFHFLVACSQQPSLPLTNKGTLHKKQLLKLTGHLNLPRDLLRSAGIAYAFRDQYDDGTALMLELAIRMGFLTGSGERLYLHEEAVKAWLRQDYATQQSDLYTIWCQLLLPAPVWLQHAIAWAEKAEGGAWYEADSIVRSVGECCSRKEGTNAYPSIYQAVMITYLAPLSIFRFLELAKDREEKVWFRWLITPRNAGKTSIAQEKPGASSIYVQPDYEVLLPPDVPLSLEWEIAAFADLKMSEQMRTYRISKESFYRAWENGRNTEEIIRLLQEHVYYDVPEPVILTLRQWGEQAGKVRMEDVTLLRCRSADIADALLRNEKCRPFLGERIGAAEFIVPKDRLAQLSKHLEHMGYHPNGSRRNKEEESSAAAGPALALQTPGICYTRDTLQLYELETELPERSDVYPDMGSIPGAWLHDFRAYHGSTRKEMIRKAIEWKSCLQLNKEGESRLIIPRGLREERSGWVLDGLEDYQEISLSGEDWQEMKLILPGINDEA
ncbi:helicase-associated domain-containing protein [Bacillus sp. 3255]|uniref:helicase-associated domain-containing protein n=1 Tax=Bacillus sp. 3255 TaxID=2817904 RepID=UPI00286158D4|nr:helicase-associated domain-containing protein [Bacillus sp. 3255]MDR6880297.1 hypothetical protein [Bacillus sp. 3255]